MSMGKNISKKIIGGVILAFLFLPIIQDITHFIYIKPLGGYIEKVKSPEFSATDWFERNFQEKKEKYLNQEFGFRNFLVRLHNQFCYQIFKEAYAKWVVVGKENYLYELGYIDSYYGRDFIGDEKIKEQAGKLKFIQDTLRKLNKNLVIVIAPSKASFYPEYIPKEYRTAKARTNFDAYKESFKTQGVDYIDFSKWFDSLKNKSQYPLYPQYGVHWSIYGAAFAFDSLVRNIEQLRKVDLPDFKIKGYETPDTLRSPDDDVYAGMNLLLAPTSYKMTYPLININDDSSKKKLPAILIGDSYCWNIVNLGSAQRIFSNFRFWYYYKEVYSNDQNQKEVSQLNLKDEIDKSDVIIILSRNADIHRLSWGFIDDCYNMYTKKKEK